MNFDRFFALAKEKGISEAQIQLTRSSATSVRLFKREIDSYSVNDSQSIIACGIYQGRFGSATTQKFGKDAFAFLIDQIIMTASYSEKDDGVGLFQGSEKYHRRNVYSRQLEAKPMKEKLALLRAVEEGIYAYDPRFSEAEVSYSERASYDEFHNSFGLKLKQKSNYFYLYAGAVARQEEETKTFADVFLDNDFARFDKDAFVKSICARTLSKFGGQPCKSGKYPTVLSRDIVCDLLSYFLTSAIADEVQRHSSFLEGKLGSKIASRKLTIEEKPLTKNVFFSYFDDEGVAAQNKVIVKKGVLKQLFYNRETAQKDGVRSSGNAAWEGSKIGTGFLNVFVKPGKHSFAEMISPIKEGVYITEIAGLGTGMNSNSGDFSCQAEGYKIVDGKIAEPLNLITLSGNLLKMLGDLKEFDNNVMMTSGAISCADAFIKKMSIGGI